MALDYSALGKRISNFRNASGFTQEQFCEKLNMSRKHISQIEAATSRPSLEALVDIANLLGISVNTVKYHIVRALKTLREKISR